MSKKQNRGFPPALEYSIEIMLFWHLSRTFWKGHGVGCWYRRPLLFLFCFWLEFNNELHTMAVTHPHTHWPSQPWLGSIGAWVSNSTTSHCYSKNKFSLARSRGKGSIHAEMKESINWCLVSLTRAFSQWFSASFMKKR